MVVALRPIYSNFWRIVKVAVLKVTTCDTGMGHLKYTHGIKSKSAPIHCHPFTQPVPSLRDD